MELVFCSSGRAGEDLELHTEGRGWSSGRDWRHNDRDSWSHKPDTGAKAEI